MHAIRSNALALRIGWSLAASIAVAGGWKAECEAKRPLDPSSCANPVCADKMKLFDMMKNYNSSAKSGSGQRADGVKRAPAGAGNSTSTGVEGGGSDPLAVARAVKQEDCPLDRGETGHSTWNFLHTLAANYPDSPNEEQKAHAQNLFHAIAALYPCPTCARDFQENIALSPPRVESREELVLWLCEQHNVVNSKLSKDEFPCNLEALDFRWRKGAPGCWDYKLSIAQEKELEEEEGVEMESPAEGTSESSSAS